MFCRVGGLVVSAVLLCGMPVKGEGAAAAVGMTMPTVEQIAKVAENPHLLADLVKNATDEQAAEILIQIIAQVDTLKLGTEAKKNRVGELFERLIDAKGTVKGNEIIARIVKKVNPRLLPIIRMGAGNGTMPPTAPMYKRQ